MVRKYPYADPWGRSISRTFNRRYIKRIRCFYQEEGIEEIIIFQEIGAAVPTTDEGFPRWEHET